MLIDILHCRSCEHNGSKSGDKWIWNNWKRVADAVDAQDDMEIVGVNKTRPAFGCDLAVKKGYPIYCTYDDEAKISAFAEAGYECHGGLSDLLSIADIVVDCSPWKSWCFKYGKVSCC